MLDWHCRAEEIQAYVDGELDGVALQECEAHLGRCEACARLAGRLLSLSQSLGAIEPQDPPSELKERILEAVARAETLPALSCAEAVEMASAYLDDELPDAERDRIETHLFTCPSCYARYQQTRSVVESLHVVPAASAPADLHARILAAVERSGARRAVFTWRRAAQVAAGFAAAAAIALAVFVPANRGALDSGASAPMVAALPDEPADAVPAVATPVEPVIAEAGANTEIARAPTSRPSLRSATRAVSGSLARSAAAVDATVPPEAADVSPAPAGPVAVEVHEPVMVAAHPGHDMQPVFATAALPADALVPGGPALPTPAVSEPATAPAGPAPATIAVAPGPGPETTARPVAATRVAHSATAVPYASSYVRGYEGGSRRDPEVDRRMAAAITASARTGSWIADDVGIVIH